MVTAAERDAHLSSSVNKVSKAIEQSENVDLIVLPELSSIDYSRESFNALDTLAEPLDGASFKAWSALAARYDVAVVYSFALTNHDGTFICVAMVDANGQLRGHYNKVHLAQYGASMEKDYFQCGSHLFTFELNGFTLAPIICYDIRIPELSRALSVEHNVDIILHCGAYYRDESFETWHDFAKTRAIENQVYLLSLNRAGEHYGNSIFCLPWMDKNTPAKHFPNTKEAFKQLHISRSVIQQAREQYSFLTDRLTDYRLPLLKEHDA